MTRNLIFTFLLAASSVAAAQDRISGNIETARLSILKGHLNPNARPELDQGVVDPATPIQYAALYLRPADGLEALLADQQNPSSPNFHKWLTPEEFGDRFGLTANDTRKVTDWLRAAGFTVHDVARGRHWITLSGTVSQASAAFHTQIHRYLVNGKPHFANSTELAIPAALEPVIAGVEGLTDFVPEPMHIQAAPQLTNGASHYLAPGDIATIYDLSPLYKAGIDGTGQKIAIVGTSDINLSDMAKYRTEYNLPANVPQVVVYGIDPGTNSSTQTEANIDLQLTGSVARNATLIYVNSTSVNNAAAYAVDQNLAPVLTMSYGGCELYLSQAIRVVAQQANAQGITWMASSGDSAAATCDRTSPTPQATKGLTVSTPAAFPEITAVGGTEFNEGSGTYWNRTNDSAGGSAMSYIPERVWNDSPQYNGLVGGGGGASAYYSKPAWQTGPGVPGDNFRSVPDVSLAASASHDGFDIYNQGANQVWGGTSASSPLFAGIIALLNQAQSQANPGAPAGLGNINPALYRLAQATSDVFHDVVTGDNVVPCEQGSPDCVDGTLGFAATNGYDRASGLGSVDAARLIAEWGTGTASTTTISASPSAISPADTVKLTATVTGAGAAPSGTVTFVADDVTLGQTTLVTGANKTTTATISIASSTLAPGNLIVGAIFNGDSNYLPSAGSVTLTLNPPASGSWVTVSVTPNPVNESQGVWPYSVQLKELAGVATRVTAFTVNNVNNLSAFSNPNLAANGTLAASLTGQNLTVPLNRDFHFEGTDAGGATWQQDLVVPFLAPLGPNRVPAITLSVSPSAAQQNPSAPSSCQWSQQVTVQETGGFQTTLSSFSGGGRSLTSSLVQDFGTTRLAPFGVLSGTICFATQPVSPSTYTLVGVSELGGTVSAVATGTFGAASGKPTSFGVSSPFLSIPPAGSASLDLQFGAGSPAWTATVVPAAQKWLTVSALSGTGNTTLQLEASATGLSAGVYRAILSIQAQDVLPQSIQVPVALVVGASGGISIAGIGNAASGAQTFAPGQLIAVYGTNLAAALQSAPFQPLPLTLASASATVNGVAAPLWFVSSAQINLQIPYETAAGPAVLAINNAGQVASWWFTASPAAPGIFAFNGSLVPFASAKAGQTIVAFITGDGDVTPSLATGASPSSSSTLAQLPKSRQPVSLTVAGEQAAIVFNGIVPGLIGVTQMNFTVPSDIAAGVQPVVVTVGGISSAPVNLTVTAASAGTI